MPELREPGVLVLVVGPSGAGKDTLIDGARVAFADRPVVFARRIVTRPSSEAERHDSLDLAAFDAAERNGLFAFHWEAHGLRYAIPATVDADLRAGRSVVCNVSRGAVPDLRARYPRTLVVFVDAPLAVRLGRIAGRARSSERPDRGRRAQAFAPGDADVAIDNGGAVAAGIADFLAAIERVVDQGPFGPAGNTTLPGTSIA